MSSETLEYIQLGAVNKLVYKMLFFPLRTLAKNQNIMQIKEMDIRKYCQQNIYSKAA